MFHALASEKKQNLMNGAVSPQPKSTLFAPPVRSVSNQSRLEMLQRKHDGAYGDQCKSSNGGLSGGVGKQAPATGLSVPTFRTTPEPMDAPAATPKKTVTINHLKLEGSTNSIDSAITLANTKVFNQANVELKKGKDVTLDEPKSKAIVGADLILDECKVPTKPTAEEKALVKENQTAGAVSAYYVKDLSSGWNTGESFVPSHGLGGAAVIIGNKGIDQTFCHELGHVLLNDGSHDVPDDTYLMHESVGASKVKLTPTQITKIKGSAFAK